MRSKSARPQLGPDANLFGGHVSTASRIGDRLASIVDRLCPIIAQVPVEHLVKTPGFIYVGPDDYWGEPSPEHRALQLELKREYDLVAELLRLLLRGAPQDLAHQLDDADSHFRLWLELRGHNWSLTPSPDRNVEAMRAAASEFAKLLGVLQHSGLQGTLLVPDTNALLGCADPASYRAIAGSTFTFVLLPTVLGELDSLKVEHRNPEVREKARAVIRRVKGWRDQGSLSAGVTVDKSIVVKSVHQEPNMDGTLSWLDSTVKDDRILASVLEVQASNPAARVVLVTGDVNLQNKADAALVESTELSL